jgi:para-nitrobenzyl esterase
LLAGLATALACGGEPPPEPILPDGATQRTTAQGAIVGAIGSHGSHTWRGLPYAEPPTGDLRWRAPRPPRAFAGTREALENGSPCVQFASGLGGGDEEAGTATGSEDCLFLNVFAPAFQPEAVPTGDARLPVMLWIHGGGNTVGSSDFYDGGHLATRHDVVVVAVNYRLGTFGWFSHPAFRGPGTSPEDASGNYGTLDLIRALEWVRENAAAFGGDPGNVTIFGESAGGTDVVTLLVSPLARGLFHRAIVQSGSANSSSVAEAENYANDAEPGHVASSREVLLTLLEADGAEDRSAARAQLEAMSDTEVATYLRGKPAESVLGAYSGGGMGGMYWMPEIVRDGYVLPSEEFPTVFARPGGAAPVPGVLGTNRDENKLFMLFGSDDIRRAFGIPLWAKDQEAYDLVAEYHAKMWKAEGADELAQALRSAGHPDVYAYRFDWDEEPQVLTLDLSKLLGAAHALEIPFVFGLFDFGRGNRFLWDEDRVEARDALSGAMMSYWTAFAYEGRPGRGRDGTLLEWTRWENGSPDASKFIVLDTPEGGGLRMSSESVTSGALIGEITTDERFPDDEKRCALYAEFVQFGSRLTAADYASVGDGMCREYPLESETS